MENTHIIILVFYYPDESYKKHTYDTYLQHLPEWIDNAKKFLPDSFKIALYMEIPEEKDELISPTVRECIRKNVSEGYLLLHDLPIISTPQNYKKYSKLGSKYISIQHDQIASSISFRDLDSPITQIDASAILYFLRKGHTYGNALVYSWGFFGKPSLGILIGGGITLKSPSVHINKNILTNDTIIEMFKTYLSNSYKGNNVKYSNRGSDEDFFLYIICNSTYKINDSIELIYHESSNTYALRNGEVVIDNYNNRNISTYTSPYTTLKCVKCVDRIMPLVKNTAKILDIFSIVDKKHAVKSGFIVKKLKSNYTTKLRSNKFLF